MSKAEARAMLPALACSKTSGTAAEELQTAACHVTSQRIFSLACTCWQAEQSLLPVV
jgi:hypothetical protein